MHIRYGIAVLQSPVSEVPTTRGTMKSTTTELCGPYGKPIVVDVVALGRTMEALPTGTPQGSSVSFEGTLESRLSKGGNRPRLLLTAVHSIAAPGQTLAEPLTSSAGQKNTAPLEVRFVPGWDSPADKTS